MKANNKSLWIAIAVLCVAAAAFFLLRPDGGSGVSLETSRVERIDIVNSVTATGTVEPVTKVDVGTQVSGIIDKLFADYNDIVKAGQIIAEMDKVNLEAELVSSEAQLSAAKTEFEYREKEYKRTEQLHEKELVSDSDYDSAYYQYQTAKNNYSQAQAAYTKVKRNLSYATISSPIDGVVISRAVEEGQTVAAGFETPTLFTIAKDLTDMQVIADVDEADIGQVKEGQKVVFTVDAYPDDEFSGTVKQVRLEATTTSNVVTYEVVITAPNPDLKLKPGLTANVTVTTLEEKGVLAVPTRALRFTPDPEILSSIGISISGGAANAPDTKTVWVRNGSTISQRAVTLDHTSGDKTGILSGISEGDEVVTGLEVAAAAQKSASTERSPFAPGPRN